MKRNLEELEGLGDGGEVSMGDADREAILELCFQDTYLPRMNIVHVHVMVRADLCCRSLRLKLT